MKCLSLAVRHQHQLRTLPEAHHRTQVVNLGSELHSRTNLPSLQVTGFRHFLQQQKPDKENSIDFLGLTLLNSVSFNVHFIQLDRIY